MITRYKTPLLIAVIVLFFVYLFVSGRSGHQSVLPGATVAVSKTGNPVINTIPSTQPGTNIQHVTQKQLPVSQPIPLTGATQPNEYVAYMSGRLSGIIGMYACNQTDNPVDNVFTVEIDRDLTKSDRVWLNYKLTGVNQYGGVSCSVNDRLSFGGHLVSTDSGTYKQRVRLHPDWLQRGDNHIRFGLAAGATYGYKVSDLAIEIERVSEAPQAVIVNNSRTLLNGKAYIHGFINSDNRYKVEIDGRPVALRDGEFEAIVQPDADSVWLVASYKAKTFRKLLRFDKKSTADFCFELDTDINKKEKLFAKNKAAQIETNLTTLTAPVKTILETRRITATDLRPIDLPALDLGMTNVTAENRGVRFLPHGEHFGGEGASVALKYDRTRIPDGYTEDDIRTFYFDPNTKHWVALERDTVDKSLCMVVSKTTHFTDMINGVIQTPESPETQGFAPTMMTDIKAADPTSKINLIAPPSANNQGSANLSYPIELPPTRNGMNPNLSITYNSDGGSGWLGEGWDLNIPSITVDTKFGVPIYKDTFETETYCLNGIMLGRAFISGNGNADDIDEKMFFPDRGVVHTRNVDDEKYQFYPRIQSGFQRVIRIGTKTTDYRWEVQDKNGTKYYYGSNGAVLSNPTLNHISEWKLQSNVDIHGDSIAYIYDIVSEDAISTLKSRAIYLNKIEGWTYNDSTKSYSKHTEIEFNRERLKSILTNNARYGFLVSSHKLLTSVIIKCLNPDSNEFETLRKYDFKYLNGVFNKDLLKEVIQFDNLGNSVANHTFNYYKDVDVLNNNLIVSNSSITKDSTTTTLTSRPQSYSLNNRFKLMPYSNNGMTENNNGEHSSSDYKNTYDITKKGGINETNTNGLGGSLYIGLGLGGNIKSVNNSIGINTSYLYTESIGKTTLIDINGDGLSDQVYTKDKAIYFKARKLDGTYMDEIELEGAPYVFSRSSNNTLSIGIGANGNIGKSTNLSAKADVDLLNKTVTNAYFSDVNSDGLIDIVYNEQVYFNYLNGGIPKFNRNSSFTSNPMTNKTIYDLTRSATSVYTYRSATDDSIKAEASPLQDLVRVWEAPYSGEVSISGDIRLLVPTGIFDTLAYEMADGVRVAIQKGNTELWSKKIEKNHSSNTPTYVQTNVIEGEKFFFRVQSGDSLLSNGDFDNVIWNPQIEYTSTLQPLESNIDFNGYSNKVFRASEGNIINKSGYNLIDSGVPVIIRSKFIKTIGTADDIKLEVFSSNYPTEYSDSVDAENKPIKNPGYHYNLVFSDTIHRSTIINDSIDLISLSSNTDRYFWFKLSSSNNVRWDAIKWYPRIDYDYSKIENGNTKEIHGRVYAGVNYSIYQNYKQNSNNELLTDYENTYPGKLYIKPYMNFDGVFRTGNIVIKDAKTNFVYYTKSVSIYPTATLSSTVNIPSFSNKFKVELYMDDEPQPNKKYRFKLYKKNTGFLNDEELSVNELPTYFLRKETDFGPMWRGWGQFEYNSAQGRYSKPIEVDSLFLPKDSTDILFDKMRLVPLAPHFETKKFLQGYSDNLKLSGDTLTSGRLNQSNLVEISAYIDSKGRYQAPKANIDNESEQQTTATYNNSVASSVNNTDEKYFISAPNLITKQTNLSYSAGGNVSINDLLNWVPKKVKDKLSMSLGGALGGATGGSKKILDYIDMNGDGYPDYFNEGEIYYSNSRGTVTNITQKTEIEENSSKMVFASASIGVAYNSKLNFKTGNSTQASIQMGASINASGTVSETTNDLKISFVDINGDGLPDMIDHQNNSVSINLGYSFSSSVPLSTFKSCTKTFGANAGLGIGVDIDNGSYSLGYGTSSAVSSTDTKLLDINGDGLVDIVAVGNSTPVITNKYDLLSYIPKKVLKVRLNKGNTFTDPIIWDSSSSIDKNIASTHSINGAGTFGTIVWIVPVVVKLVFNPSIQASTTNTKLINDIRDYDGDGFPDMLSTDLSKNELTVKYSKIARTNKLKSITNPLGGSFTLDYARSEPSTDHPGGKWVVKTVIVNDGVTDDGEYLKNEFAYKKGKYNRREREFSGFGEVIISNNENNLVYRKTIQNYDVSNYYVKGNLLKTAVYDGNENKVQETVNQYYGYKIATKISSKNNRKYSNYIYQPLVAIPSDTIVVYSPLKYSKSTFYAGDSLISNQTHYSYWVDYDTKENYFGDLKTFKTSDKGGLNEDGTGTYDYQTSIWYKSEMTDKYFVAGLPTEVKVEDKNKTYRHLRAYYTHTGYPTHMTRIVQYPNNTDSAVTRIDYDKAGNIIKKELPSGMFYNYTYDDKYKMYPTRVTDAFGYTTELSNYDYRFGIPRTTTDMNGNISTTTLDNLGRIVSITGPNEYDPNDPAKHTIKFEYYPGAVTKNTNGTINSPAYAVTRHYDPLHPTDSIVTVTFVDGFGRPVQVKKDAVINGESKMIVSGRTRYDALGRAVESYYPTVDELSNRTTFKREYDNYKTVNTYDVLDRVLTTRLPDGATTTMSYGIADSMLVTTVVDAEEGKQQTFTNGSGLTVKTLQYKHVNPDTVLTTLFDYDGVNQLVKVTDDAGKITESIYDLAGRRTQVTHPASGITKFEYDVASNLIAKQTANMLADNGNKKIQYFYAYNRLDSIVYPDHPENNVKYTYGAANDPVATRRGRLVSQEDGSGAQEFSYGKQGELTQVRRTLVIPNQAVATYVTGWKYDSWNRLLEMTYPDGEKVNYSYNTGGLLTAVASSANTYVSNILYDKFEQRTNLTYGNGAVTTYQYNPANRQLNNLSVVSNNNTIMNNAYHYDKVSNVTKIINTGASADNMGGAITHNYGYDKLYRLTSANGQFRGVNGKKADYALTMRYDNMHNITYKKQEVVQQGIKFDGVMNAGYELNYTINANNSQQIANIADASYRADRGTAGTYQLGEQSGDEVTTKAEDYGYDANGNLIYVLKGTRKADSTLQVTSTRSLLWDEENRLLALSDNGYVSNYWYDAAGERVVKQSGGSMGIQVNGVLSAARTETTKFTAYVSPYLVVSNGGNYTKHIYMGSQRIASKLFNSTVFGGETPISEDPASRINFRPKYNHQTEGIKGRFNSLGVKYHGKLFPNETNTSVIQQFDGGGTSFTPVSYFYHSDHLGSSSLITDGTGHTVQHIEYIPFGETFIEERNSTWNTPYKFNGKEQDEETGLYYYGARYYDPRTSVWLSVDPLAEKYSGYSSYVYCLNNPILYIDPDGKQSMFGWSQGLTSKQTNQVVEAWRKAHQRAIHPMLDGAGMVPVFGEAADGLNGLIYLAEGDKINASLSFGACVPFIGWLSTSAKWAKNVFKLSDNALHLTSGLFFKLGSKEGNRLYHVYSHFENNLTKKNTWNFFNPQKTTCRDS